MHANQNKRWKDQLLEGATAIFGDEVKTEPAGMTVDVKTLHAEIGELTLENDASLGAYAAPLAPRSPLRYPERCIEAVEEVLARYDKPDIFNTD